MTKNYKVKCPVCRESTIISENQKEIRGNSDICVICQKNEVSIFFPDCGHVNTCSECYCKIRKLQIEPREIRQQNNNKTNKEKRKNSNEEDWKKINEEKIEKKYFERTIKYLEMKRKENN